MMTGVDVYQEVIRTARKQHRCCECYRLIHPGTRYMYASGVWDGRGASYKTCLDCEDLRQRVVRNPEWFGGDAEWPCFGHLYEAASEVNELKDPDIMRFAEGRIISEILEGDVSRCR